MLIDVVSNLKIDDATQRTDIIDNISAIYSQLNQTRAALKKKTQELMSVEGEAEFHSQVKLINQAVVNFLDVCDTPEKCDEYLTKLMVQIEELEGRFAEFDEFVLELSEKREEVYSAFDGKKVALVEARNKRATTLMSAAERILKGIETRVGQLESVNEIHSYFAADLMVEKVRDIVAQLDELDDIVKVDDIQSRLKTIREDAVRQLKDRHELFVDGRKRHPVWKAPLLGQCAAAGPDDGHEGRPHAVPFDRYEFLGGDRRCGVSFDRVTSGRRMTFPKTRTSIVASTWPIRCCKCESERLPPSHDCAGRRANLLAHVQKFMAPRHLRATSKACTITTPR